MASEPGTVESWVLEGVLPGERLDVALRKRMPGVSRGTLQRLLGEGAIRVNGQQVKPSHAARVGDRVEVVWPGLKPSEAQPQAMQLDILHEDEALLVLNKAAGMVVHPAAGNEDRTLVNALLHHCAGRLSGIGGVERPGIVHRLDKDTTGCLVVAKDDATHQALAAQFAGRTVTKFYQALVLGRVAKDSGVVEAAIARHPSHRKRMAVTEGGAIRGREARTGYRVVERMALATWVEAELFTGRTHQIRVHFHHLGHPLVGDETYGGRRLKTFEAGTGLVVARQMLHAARLGFMHPLTRAWCRYEAPLPDDFKAVLRALGSTHTEEER